LVIFGYFWLFLVIFGYFWLFLVIFGYFWLFLVIFGYFWLFLFIFGYFWLFLVIFGYFRMGNSTDVLFCLCSGGTERFDWNAPGSFERTTLRRTATCGCARVWGRMATV
jgi:hypothetical protein